jgi:hypothetical protein
MKTAGYLRAVTGVPDPVRGYFVIKLIYRDRNDKKQKTITLDIEDELADLAAIGRDGMEWYADQARDDDDEILRRER